MRQATSDETRAPKAEVLDGGLVSQVVPERQEVAAALGLFGMVVTEATGFKDGRLLVEWVLRSRVGTAATMTGQLAHLLTVMPLPSVSLGIIPLGTPRTVWPLEAFYLYDDQHTIIEILTAGISVRQPRELADYARAFTGLSSMAVHGDAARVLIRSAIDALE